MEWRTGPRWSVQKYFNSGKGEKGANRAGNWQWSTTGGKKGGKGRRKVAKVTSEFGWSCGKNRTHCGKIAPRGVGTRV